MFVGFFLRYGMMVEIDMKTKEEKILKLVFFSGMVLDGLMYDFYDMACETYHTQKTIHGEGGGCSVLFSVLCSFFIGCDF